MDAYLVVFSITDRRSFQKADEFVLNIRKEGHTSEAIIIVANKSDLVRSRIVAEEGEKLRRHVTPLVHFALLVCLKALPPATWNYWGQELAPQGSHNIVNVRVCLAFHAKLFLLLLLGQSST